MSAPENTLWQGRPSWWTVWPSLAAADLLLLTAAALWWTGRDAWAPYAVASAAPFYLAAVVRRASAFYKVTDQRVTSVTGTFSRRVDEVEAADIRNIVLTQSLAERLVGIGTVGVSTSAGDGIEVTLRGVPGAEAVKEAVRAARQKSPKTPEAPSGGNDG